MRKSNFELLRLVCMFLVLLLHANYLSIGVPEYEGTPRIEFLVRNLLEVVPFIAVNVFILISGWFSIRPSVKSVANLLFCCLFYSVGIRLVYYLVCSINGTQPQFDFWSSFLFISNSVWFVADYLMLMVFAPVLNAFVDTVSKRTLIVTLVLMLFFAFYFGLFRKSLVEYISGFSFVTFILVYMIGRVLALNRSWIEERIKPWMIWGGYFLGVIGFYLVVLVSRYLGHESYLVNLGTSRIFTYTNPLLILSAVCFFWLFARKVFYSPLINKMAKSTFAILLIHANPVAIYYYNRYFRFLYDQVPFALYLVLMVLSCFAVFAVSIAVDQLRIFIYDKGISPCVVHVEEKFTRKNEGL